MGYIKHNAVIVTGWEPVKVTEAYIKAVEILGSNSQLVSNIVQGVINGQLSFFIAPDGSKESWETSTTCDEARKAFQDWMLKADNYCDYIEVQFGGDDDNEYIVRSKHKDLC